MFRTARENSPILLYRDHMPRLYLELCDLRVLHCAEQSPKVPGRLVHAEIGHSFSVSAKMPLKRRYSSGPHIRPGVIESDRDPVHSTEINIFP